MNHRVILDAQNEMVGGVDVFSVTLADELMQRNIPVTIVLTNSRVKNAYGVAFPEHLPIERLQTAKMDPWPARWKLMIRYLEERAPCIYIPNYDFDYSCVSSKLSKRVLIAGIVHSDDPLHYEHALRIGKYWNGIVAVSESIGRQLTNLNPELASRLAVIPYGVKVPASVAERNGDRLSIIYCGRLVQDQKRVWDLVPIIREAAKQNLPFYFTIVGDGPEREGLQKDLHDLIERGDVCFTGLLANSVVLEQFDMHHAVLLVSEFEGTPIAVLEAMARGCVPVVADIRSGVPEMIQDGRNGFVVKPGNAVSFVERLRLLHQDVDLRNQMSAAAHETIREKYNSNLMTTRYLEFFQRLKNDAESGIFKRPRGRIFYPSRMKITWKDHLPARIRVAAWRAKTFANRVVKIFPPEKV